MKRPYKAMDVAKYIITKCTRDEHPISNLQLQKILYILQKEYLQRDQKCLFFDDFEAWAFGPNIPNVYYYFCGFGSIQKYNLSLYILCSKLCYPIFFEMGKRNKVTVTMTFIDIYFRYILLYN